MQYGKGRTQLRYLFHTLLYFRSLCGWSTIPISNTVSLATVIFSLLLVLTSLRVIVFRRSQSSSHRIRPLLSKFIRIEKVSIVIVVKISERVHILAITRRDGLSNVITLNRITRTCRRDARPHWNAPLHIPNPHQIVQTLALAHARNRLPAVEAHIQKRDAIRRRPTRVHHLAHHVLGVLGVCPVPYAVCEVLLNDARAVVEEGRIVSVSSLVIGHLESRQRYFVLFVIAFIMFVDRTVYLLLLPSSKEAHIVQRRPRQHHPITPSPAPHLPDVRPRIQIPIHDDRHALGLLQLPHHLRQRPPSRDRVTLVSHDPSVDRNGIRSRLDQRPHEIQRRPGIIGVQQSYLRRDGFASQISAQRRDYVACPLDVGEERAAHPAADAEFLGTAHVHVHPVHVLDYFSCRLQCQIRFSRAHLVNQFVPLQKRIDS
mmetsp:Transcript_30560/g.66072  ORF Transcript_30560/g.66072 Transcript_30560/m.66072 type:complete len:429 (-) Transcript_30560:750-2036(-)